MSFVAPDSESCEPAPELQSDTHDRQFQDSRLRIGVSVTSLKLFRAAIGQAFALSDSLGL
jgi:hypothetical protein